MRTISIAVLSFVVLSYAVSGIACTTIIVGKDATSDGSIIIARNEDSDGAVSPQNMIFHPSRKESWVFKSNSITNPEDNKFEFKLPKNSLLYISWPHWQSETKQNHSFEETGINEYGVALSATETIFNSEQVLKIDPYLVKTGVTEDSITTVVLPFATSAKEGVRILGGLVEKMGAGEGFGVAFIDRHEAWYLETASGHQWLAMKIPDDSYFVSANQGRFQSADFSDTVNAMSSPGLLDFAIANKLYDPQKEPFNFFKIFISNTAHDQTYNYPRVKTLLAMYSNILYEGNDGLYPVFVRPKKKMSVQDVARGLRNKYDGTPHDPYQNKNPKEPYRPISVIRSAISHITQTRKDMPEDLASVQYIALGMTDLAAYIPFYKGITNIPHQYQGAKEKADDNSSFWKYRKLQSLTMQDYPRFAPIVHAAIAKLEKDISERQAKMEKGYLKVFRRDPRAARELIQAFTDKTVSKQDEMLNRLIGKISRMLGMENLTNEQYTDIIKKIEAEYHFHGA